jgi:hypothetical protein
MVLILFFSSSAYAALAKPAVPEFTVEVYDSSYDIPAKTTTDPFTGQPVTNPGRHIESRTIEFRIKNPYQPLDSKTYPAEFSYNIRWKGHFDQNEGWRNVFEPREGFLNPSSTAETIYTVVAYPGGSNEIDLATWSCHAPVNARIDFQVEAFIGGYAGDPLNGWTFTGQTSGWSNTQTITLDFNTPVPPYIPASIDSHSTNSPTPTLQPTTTLATPEATSASTQPNIQTEFSILFDWNVVVAVLAVMVVIVIFAITVFRRKGTGKPPIASKSKTDTSVHSLIASYIR